MKTRQAKLLWKSLLCLTVIGLIFAVLSLHPDSAIQNSVAETRQTLHQQGFKTDLADFNFSTAAELHTRADILMTAAGSLPSTTLNERLDLMPVAGNDAVITVWKQAWVQTGDGTLQWTDLHDTLDAEDSALDDASEAAASGPFAFALDARDGAAMTLPHLSPLRNLALALGNRTLLELHDGKASNAWTNLFAITRLVTAWEPEPTEISHLVRAAMANEAFNVTWQALQSDGWTDPHLAALQQEWEALDLFKHLPETMAFTRASIVAMCQENRKASPTLGLTLPQFFKEAASSPVSALSELHQDWSEVRYRTYGTYDDEKSLLLFYRDREIELRKAIVAPTWEQMRALPGVTNAVPFQSPYPSRLQTILNRQGSSMGFQRLGGGLMGRTAITESRRRLIITALALERHRLRYRVYPQTLLELVPEFLKTSPVDFMDGQSLRYRLTDDGHYVLYSVGLNCVDDGGKIPVRSSTRPGRGLAGPFATADGDLVWPRPATTNETGVKH